MAWTAAELAALEAAIAKGVKSVQFSDQRTDFHSVDEMLKLRLVMKRELDTTIKRHRLAVVSKGT